VSLPCMGFLVPFAPVIFFFFFSFLPASPSPRDSMCWSSAFLVRLVSFLILPDPLLTLPPLSAVPGRPHSGSSCFLSLFLDISRAIHRIFPLWAWGVPLRVKPVVVYMLSSPETFPSPSPLYHHHRPPLNSSHGHILTPFPHPFSSPTFFSSWIVLCLSLDVLGTGPSDFSECPGCPLRMSLFPLFVLPTKSWY